MSWGFFFFLFFSFFSNTRPGVLTDWKYWPMEKFVILRLRSWGPWCLHPGHTLIPSIFIPLLLPQKQQSLWHWWQGQTPHNIEGRHIINKEDSVHWYKQSPKPVYWQIHILRNLFIDMYTLNVFFQNRKRSRGLQLVQG